MRYFLSTLIIFLLCGCSPHKDRSIEQDPLESSYRLMDQGKVTEAIAQLEDLSLTDSRSEVKVALASAYAERAGIRLQKFLNLASYFGFLTRQTNLQVSNHSQTPFGEMVQRLQSSPEFEKTPAFQTLVLQLAEFDLWMLKLDAIPVVQGKALEDLNRAVQVLENTSPGGHLYRALLGVVLYKVEFMNGFTKWGQLEGSLRQIDFGNLVSRKNLRLVCVPEVKAFSVWLFALITRLKAIAIDVSIALPTSKTDLDPLVKKVSETSQQAQVLMEAACLFK